MTPNQKPKINERMKANEWIEGIAILLMMLIFIFVVFAIIPIALSVGEGIACKINTGFLLCHR